MRKSIGNGSLEDLTMSFLLFLNIRQFYFSYVRLPEGNLTWERNILLSTERSCTCSLLYSCSKGESTLPWHKQHRSDVWMGSVAAGTSITITITISYLQSYHCHPGNHPYSAVLRFQEQGRLQQQLLELQVPVTWGLLISHYIPAFFGSFFFLEC